MVLIVNEIDFRAICNTETHLWYNIWWHHCRIFLWEFEETQMNSDLIMHHSWCFLWSGQYFVCHLKYFSMLCLMRSLFRVLFSITFEPTLIYVPTSKKRITANYNPNYWNYIVYTQQSECIGDGVNDSSFGQ